MSQNPLDLFEHSILQKVLGLLRAAGIKGGKVGGGSISGTVAPGVVGLSGEGQIPYQSSGGIVGLAPGAVGTVLVGGTDPSYTASPTLTGELAALDVKASGLTGATAASRYVGATASGAPASGTFAVGDYAIDQTGKVWVNTVAGSPGTWTQVGGVAAHNILSATHGDSDAADTPVEGDNLVYRSGKWVAEAAAAGLADLLLDDDSGLLTDDDGDVLTQDAA